MQLCNNDSIYLAFSFGPEKGINKHESHAFVVSLLIFHSKKRKIIFKK